MFSVKVNVYSNDMDMFIEYLLQKDIQHDIDMLVECLLQYLHGSSQLVDTLIL